MDVIDFQGVKLYKWQIGPSTFIANPTRGARLMNWFIEYADGSIRDIIYWPENADMGEGFSDVRGGNPILFPFAGRSHVDGEKGKWKTPDGKILPMPQHGIAKQGEFELVDFTKVGFSAKFIPSQEAKEAYPYKYEFIVKYRFNEFSLGCDFVLSNKDDKSIQWAAGHHFYFKLPWHEKLTRKDYIFSCDSKKAFNINDQGNLIPIDSENSMNFSDPRLSNRIHCKLKSNIVKFGSKNEEENITLRIGDDQKPSPTLSIVTWTENDNSPFYCVEPWMSPPNAIGNDIPVKTIEPSSSSTFSVEVSIL